MKILTLIMLFAITLEVDGKVEIRYSSQKKGKKVEFSNVFNLMLSRSNITGKDIKKIKNYISSDLKVGYSILVILNEKGKKKLREMLAESPEYPKKLMLILDDEMYFKCIINSDLDKLANTLKFRTNLSVRKINKLLKTINRNIQP